MSESIRIYEEPVSEPSDDWFGRSNLVRVISDHIRKCEVEKSSAIGICGEWGAGKTSVINLICKELSNDADRSQIRIVEFNPWLYTTQEDLSREFFIELSSIFEGSIRKRLKYAKKCIEYLEPLAESPLISDPLFKLLLNYSVLLSKNDNSNKSIRVLKNEISKKMGEQEKRTLIIIDDVDRLDDKEIRMIFKLVRSVADFPNTIYLLGYDEDVVSKALDSEMYDGYDYLAKIIHLPIHLPIIDQRVILDTISRMFEETVGKEMRDEHTLNILEKCVYPFLKHMRDVNQVFGRFRVKFLLSENNTHPADLLAISTLEYLDKDILRWVFDNRRALTNGRIPTTAELISHEIESIESFFDKTELGNFYSNALAELFPHFRSKGIGDKYEVASAEHWICIPNAVDNYFDIDLPPNSLTDNIISSALHEYDILQLKRMFDTYSKTVGLNTVLYSIWLRSKIETFEPDRIRLFSDYMMGSDEYFSDNDEIPFNWGISRKMAPFILTYIKNLDDAQIVEYARQTMPKSNIFRLARLYWAFHDIELEENKGVIESIKELIINRIHSNYENYPVNVKDINFISLICCVSISNKEYATEIFNHYIHNENEIKSFISSALEFNVSSTDLVTLIDPSYCEDPSIKELMQEWSRWQIR